MTGFLTDPIVLLRQLPLFTTTPYYIYVASYLLIYILLGYNILDILYYKYTPLTDTSFFSPTAFTKGFISYLKSTYLSRQKGYLIGYSLYTFS
jgi:hypothetical protein